MMKYIIVIPVELERPEELSDVLHKIDPPRLRGFEGSVQVAIDPVASQVQAWLNEE